jgi:hypothetical protein
VVRADDRVRGALADPLAARCLRAIEHAGEGAVGEAVVAALAPYRRADGGYTLENAFRLVLARS